MVKWRIVFIYAIKLVLATTMNSVKNILKQCFERLFFFFKGDLSISIVAM